MAVVQIQGLVKHVLELPMIYPGPHNESQPRLTEQRTSLEPAEQLLLIWDAMCDFLGEQLGQGKSLSIRDFGSFAFERTLEVAKPHIPETGRIAIQREVLKPCFIVADSFLSDLSRQSSKKVIERGHISGSIFQLKSMMFLNPVAIAIGCSLPQRAVSTGIKALFDAAKNLTRANYDVELDFKFAVLRIIRRSLMCVFHPSLQKAAQGSLDQQKNLRKTVSRHWKESHLSKVMVGYLADPEKLNMNERRSQTNLIAKADFSAITSHQHNTCKPL